MSGFLTELKTNVASLPASLKTGLRPGVSKENQVPAARMRRSFLFHIHPVSVTPRALELATTMGLGLVTLTLFSVLGITGVLLMIYYVPTPEEALITTQDIQHAVTVGSFVRALHRWAAHGMVLTAFLHLVRVMLTGAYFRRELNWLIGLCLFLLTLGLAFTGYLLPWDQLSFWAVTVSANLMNHLPGVGIYLKRLALGGDTVGSAALIRFYTLHVALLPGLMAGLIIFHLWRIRKDGGLARPPDEESNVDIVPAWPHLLLREAVLVLATLAVIAVVALLLTAPLGGAPDVHHPSNPEKTPWYFLFLQEAVSFSAPVGGFVFPGVILLGLLALPFIDRRPDAVGRLCGSPKERVVFAVSAALALLLFSLLESLFQRPAMVEWLTGMSPLARDILNPATGMVLASVIGFFVAGLLARTVRAAVLSAAAVLLISVMGFTAVGFSRGPGWLFYWPWEAWPNG
jgi:quinol-cytochrome oxidoreductase complex cytochrome b subunit